MYVNVTDIRTKHQHLTHNDIPITRSIKRIDIQRLLQNPLHQPFDQMQIQLAAGEGRVT